MQRSQITGRCMYTAQGEVICTGGERSNKSVERFVKEEGNLDTNAYIDMTNTLTEVVKQNYCEISMEADPSTGKTNYLFRKDCQNRS